MDNLGLYLLGWNIIRSMGGVIWNAESLEPFFNMGIKDDFLHLKIH